MVNYKIFISQSAKKSIKKLPPTVVKNIISEIKILASDPYPTGCKKIVGHTNAFKLRVGNYRIIYEVNSSEILIQVLKIGHRKDIYRNL